MCYGVTLAQQSHCLWQKFHREQLTGMKILVHVALFQVTIAV